MGVGLLVIEVLHAKRKMHQSCASRLSNREKIGEQSFKLPLPDRSQNGKVPDRSQKGRGLVKWVSE